MAKVKSEHKSNSGTRITRQVAEDLAGEAERGYDLSIAKRRRVGRPSLSGEALSSPRVSFRTTPQLYQAVQRRADLEGRSVSDLAREALSTYVNR